MSARDQGAASNQEYAVKVYFEATPDEFDALQEKITDAITEAMGCTDSPEHECPHFRAAFASPVVAVGGGRFGVRSARCGPRFATGRWPECRMPLRLGPSR